MDTDEVRRRRVERLAQLQSQAPQSRPSNSNTPDTQASNNTPHKPQSNPVELSVEKSKQTPQPHSQPQNPTIKSKNVAEPTQNNLKPQISKPEVTLSSILKITPVIKLSDIPNVDIPELIWSQLLLERKSYLTYLATCFSRSSLLKTHGFPEEEQQVKECVARYALLVCTSEENEVLYEDILKFVLNYNDLNQLFLAKIVEYAGEEEDLYDVLISRLVHRIYFPDYNQGSVQAMVTFNNLEIMLNVDALAIEMLSFDARNRDLKYISGDTFLGKMFSSLNLVDSLIKQQSAKVVCETPVENLMFFVNTLSKTGESVLQSMLKLVQFAIRKSPETRGLVLGWLKHTLNVNHGQMAMNRQLLQLHSLEFMLYILYVLLNLSNPFLKLDSGNLMNQLNKVDTEYFANKVSYDISDETKALSTENSDFINRNEEKPLNFVTECFFITCGYMQFGLNATYQYVSGSLKSQLSNLQENLDRIVDDPNMRPLPEQFRNNILNRYYDKLAPIPANYVVLNSIISSADFRTLALRFAQFNLAFDIYAAENKPQKLEIVANWDGELPEAYANLPEFMIEAPLNIAINIVRSKMFLTTPSLQEYSEMLLDASIFYMGSPKTLRNPYLRSKFVEIVYFGGMDIRYINGNDVPGPFSTYFYTADTCRKYLLRALMSVFIDIEHTGRTSQFYEKFSIRELVGNVMIILWRDPHYQQQLVTGSEEDPYFFVKFVALLLSDATYLLDEALGKLAEVHKLEIEVANEPLNNHESEMQVDQPQNNSTNPSGSNSAANPGLQNGNENENENENEDEDGSGEPVSVTSRLIEARKIAKNFLHLSSSTVELLNTFTKSVPRVFVTPEIVDRFATMLNYNLAALIGPRCGSLKVKDAASVGFYPRRLLTDVVKVYLNLKDEEPFPKALARDERSYSKKNFDVTCSILTKYSLLSPIDIDNLKELANKTEAAWQETLEEEEEFGDDVPDEYLDPLMFTMMENPVTLPVSKMNIDLSTIKAHLLNDPTDPFNRVPLKIEDVVPNESLKNEIQEYKRQVKEANKQKKSE